MESSLTTWHIGDRDYRQRISSKVLSITLYNSLFYIGFLLTKEISFLPLTLFSFSIYALFICSVFWMYRYGNIYISMNDTGFRIDYALFFSRRAVIKKEEKISVFRGKNNHKYETPVRIEFGNSHKDSIVIYLNSCEFRLMEERLEALSSRFKEIVRY